MQDSVYEIIGCVVQRKKAKSHPKGVVHSLRAFVASSPPHLPPPFAARPSSSASPGWQEEAKLGTVYTLCKISCATHRAFFC